MAPSLIQEQKKRPISMPIFSRIPPRRAHKSAGFTLIELSIVMAIAGLVISVVLGGQLLLDTAKTKSLMDEVDEIYNAQKLFQARYNQLPGDMWDASTRLGMLDDGVTPATDGDGDGVIDAGTEQLAYWQHLALAGLLPGEFDATTIAPGTGVYPSQYGESVGYMVNGSGNYTISRYVSGAADYAFISPLDAASLDADFDDGDESTGLITATLGTEANGNCIAAGNYDLSNIASACTLTFSVQEASIVDNNRYSGGAYDTCNGIYNVGDSVADIACPGGQTGTYTKICRNGGIWEVDVDLYPCADPGTFCASTIAANTFWPDAEAGAVSVEGTCLPGFTGSPVQDCTGPAWDAGSLTGSCT